MAEPDLFLARDNQHTTGQLDLMGCRLAVVSESDADARLDESKMKRLTGGDRIRARRMRQDFIEFSPSHLALMVTNHLPTVRGDDPATWARLRVIPFEVVIPEAEQDKDLGGKLEVEANAVLSWAIAGWISYRDQGMAEPEAIKGSTGDYQADSDDVGRFIEDKCVTGPGYKAITATLFLAWSKWRTDQGGVPEMSQKAFGQALGRKGYPTGKRTTEGRLRYGIELAS
jgi:putative DNA primase/helicase